MSQSESALASLLALDPKKDNLGIFRHNRLRFLLNRLEYLVFKMFPCYCYHNTTILITPQKYEKELKPTNILRDFYIYSFLFTQTLWLPLPVESIGEVRSAVISFSSREAAVRLRLLMQA